VSLFLDILYISCKPNGRLCTNLALKSVLYLQLGVATRAAMFIVYDLVFLLSLRVSIAFNDTMPISSSSPSSSLLICVRVARASSELFATHPTSLFEENKCFALWFLGFQSPGNRHARQLGPGGITQLLDGDVILPSPKTVTCLTAAWSQRHNTSNTTDEEDAQPRLQTNRTPNRRYG
jgi:hypothetical protein